MKVMIIYDNTTLRTELKADWGFSALRFDLSTPLHSI